MTSPFPFSLLVQQGFPFTFPLPAISYPVVAGFIGISVGIELQFHHYVQKTGWLALAQINVLSWDKHKPVKQHGIVLWEGPAHCAQVTTIQSRFG